MNKRGELEISTAILLIIGLFVLFLLLFLIVKWGGQFGEGIKAFLTGLFR